MQTCARAHDAPGPNAGDSVDERAAWVGRITSSGYHLGAVDGAVLSPRTLLRTASWLRLSVRQGTWKHAGITPPLPPPPAAVFHGLARLFHSHAAHSLQPPPTHTPAPRARAARRQDSATLTKLVAARSAVCLAAAHRIHLGDVCSGARLVDVSVLEQVDDDSILLAIVLDNHLSGRLWRAVGDSRHLCGRARAVASCTARQMHF